MGSVWGSGEGAVGDGVGDGKEGGEGGFPDKFGLLLLFKKDLDESKYRQY